MQHKICLLVFLISHAFFYAQTDTQKMKKESFFPLMKKVMAKADSLGMEFPKPFGISAGMYFQNQNMNITQIKVGSIILNDSDDYVNIDNSSIENTTTTTQIRGDLWVLPFVNIYGMAGRVTTFNNLKLRFNLNIPPIPGLTEGDFRTLERDQLVAIDGTVLAFGTVLAGGYKKLFVNVNLSWARTHLEQLESEQKAFAAFPMIGMQTNFANIFFGALYLDSGQVNRGSFISDAGEIVNYEVEFDSQQWNYNIGLNKFVGHWAFSIIQGFGERKSTIIEVGYRF